MIAHMYFASEYAEGGRATDKVDVYSFGVVLLELLSGKRPADGNDGEDIGLAAWVIQLIPYCFIFSRETILIMHMPYQPPFCCINSFYLL